MGVGKVKGWVSLPVLFRFELHLERSGTDKRASRAMSRVRGWTDWASFGAGRATYHRHRNVHPLVIRDYILDTSASCHKQDLRLTSKGRILFPNNTINLYLMPTQTPGLGSVRLLRGNS